MRSTARTARTALPRLGRAGSFRLLAVTLLVVMAAAAAPTPLYPVYQQRWGLSAITLTAVFAVYAIALLVALLTVGSVSDHVGRRPVLAAGLLGEVAAMLAFATADDVWSLLGARALQGLAVGVLTGTLSAALVDHQPPGRPNLAAVINSAAPGLGLAAGAVGSGLLVQYAPRPTALGYALLAGAFVALTATVLLLPETVLERRRPAAASLLPRIAVPPAARPTFGAAVPALVSTWAVGGLYLALGPTVAATALHLPSHLVAGAVVGTLFVAGAAATVATDRVAPRRAMRGGAAVLATGMAVSLLALAGTSVPGFLAGTAIAGAGFGVTFLGVLRSLGSLARPAERAGLFAAVFVVSYLAFSIPTVVAGALVPSLGLLAVVRGYGLVVIVLAVAVVLTRPRRRPAADPATPDVIMHG